MRAPPHSSLVEISVDVPSMDEMNDVAKRVMSWRMSDPRCSLP